MKSIEIDHARGCASARS